MVKYSKYLIILWATVYAWSAEAQMKGSFDAIERDSEITRVALENHFKHWDEAQLLNQITSTEVSYQSGTGLLIDIEAPNTRIFLENQSKWTPSGDQELLDTFYSNEVIGLQQHGLSLCLAQFTADFHGYLPKIKTDEGFVFRFTVSDPETKQISDESKRRHYELTLTISSTELAQLVQENESIDTFLKAFKKEVKPL